MEESSFNVKVKQVFCSARQENQKKPDSLEDYPVIIGLIA